MLSLKAVIEARAAKSRPPAPFGSDWCEVLPEDLVSFGIRWKDVSLYAEVQHAWECFTGQAQGGVYDGEHSGLLETERVKYPELAAGCSAEGFIYFVTLYSRLNTLEAQKWWHRMQAWNLRTGLVPDGPSPPYPEFAAFLRQRKEGPEK